MYVYMYPNNKTEFDKIGLAVPDSRLPWASSTNPFTALARELTATYVLSFSGLCFSQSCKHLSATTDEVSSYIRGIISR